MRNPGSPVERESLHSRRVVEVTWGDCDASGMVFYPRYYQWFDACTHTMLSAVGLDHHELRRAYGVIGASLVEASAYSTSRPAGPSFHASHRIAPTSG